MNDQIDDSLIGRALANAVEQYRAEHPNSAARQAAAADHMPGGNTRTSLWNWPFPLCMVRGDEAELTDADGITYTDFLGEFTAGIYGHSSTVLKQAIAKAMDEGMNLSSHNRLESAFAERLCARFPSFDLVRFCNSGTEANLMALSAAIAFTGRRKVIVFEKGYHGAFMTFSGGARSINAPYDFIVVPYNDVIALRETVGANADRLAAILVEPMLGAGGCIPGTDDFLQEARKLADASGAVLIFDEVQTARLHHGGRQAELGITPDLTTIGKFFGGGLAFGCFGGRRAIMDQFNPANPGALPHSGTFNNNTLVMAAGISAVDNLLTADALNALNARGDNLRERLNLLFRDCQAPFQVTGIGSLMSIHCLDASNENALKAILFFDLVQSKFIIASRGLIALSFSISNHDVDALFGAVRDFVKRRAPLWSGV